MQKWVATLHENLSDENHFKPYEKYMHAVTYNTLVKCLKYAFKSSSDSNVSVRKKLYDQIMLRKDNKYSEINTSSV